MLGKYSTTKPHPAFQLAKCTADLLTSGTVLVVWLSLFQFQQFFTTLLESCVVILGVSCSHVCPCTTVCRLSDFDMICSIVHIPLETKCPQERWMSWLLSCHIQFLQFIWVLASAGREIRREGSGEGGGEAASVQLQAGLPTAWHLLQPTGTQQLA